MTVVPFETHCVQNRFPIFQSQTLVTHMSQSFRIALFFCAVVALFHVPHGLLAQSDEKKSSREHEREEREREEREHDKEWYEHEEEENEYRARPAQPMPWGGGITVQPIEGPQDTIRFHIGSPLFLRLKLDGEIACQPFNGQPFYFDISGAQLGWGFQEISDSILFPHAAGECERIVMLSSENSNRIPEGVYSLKVMIFVDEHSRLYSDTLVVHPVRSADGADELSYSRFLLEQLVRNSPLLQDHETVQALFAEGTPRSATSEVYRALVLYRGGDIAGAESALHSSAELARVSRKSPDPTATAIATYLRRLLTGDAASQ
jgi:hypothetical protein